MRRLSQQPRRRVGLRIGVTATVGSALIAIAVVSGSEPEPSLPSPDARRSEVRDALERIHGNWTPHSLRSLLESLPDAKQCLPALEAILASPDDHLFDAAVKVATQQRHVVLVPDMRAALPRAKDRTQDLIIRATDELVPWTDDELDHLLASESIAVVAAGLEVAGSRSGPRMDAVIARLVDPVAALRASALAAIPDPLDLEDALRIADAQRSAFGSEAREALLALARCPDAAIDPVLYEQLDAEPARCDAALDALAARGTALAQPAAVHRLIGDPSLPWPTRARAIRCLEQTGSLAGADALQDIWPSHPVLEYFAARVLIRAGHPSGVRKLLELIGPHDDLVEEDSAAVMTEVCMSARQILAALSGTGVYSGESEWEAWAQRVDNLAGVVLPETTVSLD